MQDIKVLKLAVAIYMTSPEGTELHWDDLTGQRQRYFIGRAKSILHALEYDGYTIAKVAPIEALSLVLIEPSPDTHMDEWERGYEVGRLDAGNELRKVLAAK